MALHGPAPAQDPSLRSLVFFSISRWSLAARLSASFLLAGMLAYFFVVPYSIRTTLQINDAQTSQLQAFTNNFFSLSKQASSTRKSQTPAQRAADYLERQDSYSAFVRFLVLETTRRAGNPELSENLAAVETLLGESLSSPALSFRSSSRRLRDAIQLRPASPTELQIETRGGNRELTFFLNSAYTRFALDALKQQEAKEVEQIRGAIARQRDLFRESFAAKNKELIAFQSRPENALSLASGPNVGNYISELLVRKNEIELKIAENERTIQYLGGARAAQIASARNLGGRSQAQQLSEENSLLRKQVTALEESIRKFTGATNGSAEAMRMHEELKKSSDREFRNFQEANDLLAKLSVYAVSIAGKFELVHAPEFEDARKASSLPLALGIAFFLAQLLFSAIVYFQWSAASDAAAAQPKPAMTATGPRPGRESLGASLQVKVLQEVAGGGAELLKKEKGKEIARGLH